jgi:hypothetical protein
MHNITRFNPNSMVVLHLGTLTVNRWTKRMVRNQYTYIKAPLTIASSPVGYSPTMVQKPLSASQVFTMYREAAGDAPWNNSRRMFVADPKSDYRGVRNKRTHTYAQTKTYV